MFALSILWKKQMNALEIRTKFVQLSGRYDLVVDTTNFADNGADFFINAGAKFLENRSEIHKNILRFQKDTVADQYFLEIPNARSVLGVFASNASKKIQLVKRSFDEMRSSYDEPFSDVVSSEPAVYSDEFIGLAPSQSALTSSDYTTEFSHDAETLSFGNHFNKRGILFLPPVDGVYTITVYGMFFPKELTSDSDVNFWSVVYPDLLIQAAMMKMESFYRNTEGVRDFVNAIDTAMFDLVANNVEQEIVGIDQMERCE